VTANKNRGGFGWQEPAYEFTRALGADGVFFTSGGRQEGKTEALRQSILKGLAAGKISTLEAARLWPINAAEILADVGDANPVPPSRKWPGAMHEDDPIDMIEINGVWMCEADARFARGVDCGAQPGRTV
jgi:hypothetical protein